MSDWRTIPMSGVHNFRDYGGYALVGGGRLKRGVLWRSGQHAGATDDDLATIADLGLASVFDLRTSKERSLYPCRRPEGFDAEIAHSADPDRPKYAPHIEAARQAGGKRDAEFIHEMMTDTYTRIAFRPELLAMTRGHAEALTRGDGPSLVNCMAGKDRTGILAAILLSLVGVDRDTVIADYAATQERIEQIRARSREENPAAAAMWDRNPGVVQAWPESMADTLDLVDEQWGDFSGWAQAHGVDAATIARLRTALVE